MNAEDGALCPTRADQELGTGYTTACEMRSQDGAHGAASARGGAGRDDMPAAKELYARQPPEGLPGMEKGQLIQLLKYIYGLNPAPGGWYKIPQKSKQSSFAPDALKSFDKKISHDKSLQLSVNIDRR